MVVRQPQDDRPSVEKHMGTKCAFPLACRQLDGGPNVSQVPLDLQARRVSFPAEGSDLRERLVDNMLGCVKTRNPALGVGCFLWFLYKKHILCLFVCLHTLPSTNMETDWGSWKTNFPLNATFWWHVCGREGSCILNGNSMTPSRKGDLDLTRTHLLLAS